MKKEELLKLLADEEVCAEIFEIVRRGGKPKAPIYPPPRHTPAQEAKAKTPPAAAAKVVPKPPVDAKQRKQDLEIEKKSALSFGAIEKLRARVERAAAEKAQADVVLERKNDVTEMESVAEEDALGFMSGETFEEEKPAPVITTPPEEEEEAEDEFDGRLSLLRQHVSTKQAEAPKKPEKAKKSDADYRFVVERTCPICGRTTRVVKYKSRLPVVRRDIDFCVHYQDANPYLYSVLACEHCGFAAEEKKFLGHYPDKTKDSLLNFLVQNDMKMEFHEERTIKEAVSVTEMAILFSELTDNSPSRRAGLHLTIAWIYRYAQNKKREIPRLIKAAELYEEALLRERTYAGGISGNTIMYLLGALYFETENYEKATGFLSRIIGDQSLRMQDPKTYDRARDLWQDIRAMKRIGVEDA